MTVYNGVDFAMTLRFEEEEARFLAGVCFVLDPDDLTEQQREVLQRIAGKFILGGQRTKDEAIERHGLDAVLKAADEALAAYPDVDEVRL